MVTEEWISLRKFAERRGVALSAVQKAIASDRVTAIKRDAAGKITGIEWHQATAQWDANTDPVEAARNGQLADPQPGLVLQADQAQPETAPEQPAAAPGEDKASGNAKYIDARATREKFSALTAERDYLISIGALVPADVVAKAAYSAGRTLRENIMNLPERLAEKLAAERDPARVHAALTQELKSILHEFASGPPAAAAAPGAG